MTQTEDWTVARLLAWTTEYLQRQTAESPRLDAEVLLAHACECPRIELYARFQETVDEPTRGRFRELVKQRAAGRPVAYLVHAKEFYSLSFEVNADVLIPRPETETLVLESLEIIKRAFGDGGRALDIGTGSGAIAICLAKYGRCHVTAVDISPAALEIARRNAATHGVDERIEFVCSDLFENLGDASYDLIATNPPYVSEAEYEQLSPTVRDFEPRLALLGGATGSEVFARIAETAPQHLRENGWLLAELSPMIAPQCVQMVQSREAFGDVVMVNDLSGLPRVLRAHRV